MRTLGKGREESRGQVGRNKLTGNEGLRIDLLKEMGSDKEKQVRKVKCAA